MNWQNKRFIAVFVFIFQDFLNFGLCDSLYENIRFSDIFYFKTFYLKTIGEIVKIHFK